MLLSCRQADSGEAARGRTGRADSKRVRCVACVCLAHMSAAPRGTWSIEHLQLPVWGAATCPAAPCCPRSGRAKAGTEALAQGLFAWHLLTGLHGGFPAGRDPDA